MTVVDSRTWSQVVKVEEYTAFLNPSHIIENIKGALLPSDLNQVALVQPGALALPNSDGSPSDFWDAVEKYENTMQDYVPQLLNSAAVFFDSTKFTDIISAMYDIVNTTATFHNTIQETLHTHDMTLDMVTEELEGVFTSIAKDLETRPSPDGAPGCAELTTMVDEILDKVALDLEHLFQRLGIEEGVATDYIRTAKPHIQRLVVAVCTSVLCVEVDWDC
ncbi:hypothetical protein JVU11DRAFT_7173 [Chiua virens]|nr:hypothetical protein JVU11DRAFT_7173 [Chiua virens]